MLYSYDIFDTLITRKTATPDGIFSLIQHKLETDSLYKEFPELLKSDFYHIRCNAEVYARKYLCVLDEITLNQIYQIICDEYSLSPEQMQELMRLECDIEVEYCIGISENIQQVENHIQQGHRVIVISDMYLPRACIHKMLIKINPIFETIPMYVSSEIGQAKITGNLFEYIKTKEDVNYTDWVHVGDGKYADNLIPRHRGITVHPYIPCKLLAYEKELVARYPESVSIQLIMGISRNIRMKYPNNAGLLSSIAFHLLSSYLCWVIEHAYEDGITDLYYLSRDGYVMKIIAESLSSYDIIHHYLYSSRDAWRIPRDFSDAAYTYDPYEYGISSISNLAVKIGIDGEELRKVLPKSYTEKTSLTHSMVEDVFLQIAGNLDLSRKVSSIWDSKRKLINKYINQEINLDSENFAFVDTHSAGITVERLQNILSEGKWKLKSYYLSPGDWGSAIKGHQENQNIHYWYGSTDIGLILEALCRAPHGKCVGYKEADKIIEPMLEGDVNEIYEPVTGYFAVLTEMAAEIKSMGILFDQTIARILFNACSSYLMSKDIDKIVLNAIGDIPFEYDSSTKRVIPFAPKFNLFTCLYEGFQILIKGHMKNTSHPVYSCRRGIWPVSSIGNLLGYVLISKNSEMINKIGPVFLPKKIAKKLKIRSIL